MHGARAMQLLDSGRLQRGSAHEIGFWIREGPGRIRPEGGTREQGALSVRAERRDDE